MATYFGRAAEENRFAQEGRELGLDRIFSCHLPGQKLATLVGLSVWNLHIARGFALEPPPVEPPVQQLRCGEFDERVPEHWPRDPVVQKLLGQLEWGSLLSSRPGWSWKADAHELCCPDGRTLELTSVRPKEYAPGRTDIIFRRPKAGCEDCEPRPDCFQSSRHAAPKHTELSVPTKLANKLRRRLARVRAGSEPTIVPIHDPPGPQLVHHSLFLPAEARRALRECFDGLSVRIALKLPPPEPLQPRFIARDVADRQRRREPWTQKRQRYALPKAASIRLTIEGGCRPTQLLALASADPRGIGATG